MATIPLKLTIAQNDLLTIPEAQLTDSDGNPISVSADIVVFRMVNYQTGEVKVNNQTAQIVDDTHVQYVWQAGDTDTAGLYQAWFIISNGGLTNRFPPEGNFYILIVESL